MPPSLEERFQQPKGWRWGYFERNDRTVRFGTISPQNTSPEAVILCLHGVREFSEKYFEVARWCLDNNFIFWTFDWVGQGKSSRYFFNSQKRHSAGFNQDVDDMELLINEHIRPSIPKRNEECIPVVMLAHSMGANLGMRYIQKNPRHFDYAAFSAPMLGIKAFQNIPQSVALAASYICSLVIGQLYIPGGNDWENRHEHARLSQDIVRKKVHDMWCKFDPDLRCGDVTFKWLHEAQKSCLKLQKRINTNIPCLFGLPGCEDLVDNSITRKLANNLSNAKVIEYPNSFHEIFMEKDTIRNHFLSALLSMIKETGTGAQESLKARAENATYK